MSASGYFITATGTDIGKTFTTCLLIRRLIARGESVHALKPVISGFSHGDDNTDTVRLLAALGKPCDEQNIAALSPWRFKAPLSPDMAAELEGGDVSVPELVSFCHRAREEQPKGHVLVEGVGGVMVPLNRRGETVLDWMSALNWPVLLVTGTYLGTLSHSLTALAAMQGRGLAPKAVIVSETAGSSVTLEQTERSLRRLLPQSVMLACVPRLASGEPLWQNAPDLTTLL